MHAPLSEANPEGWEDRRRCEIDFVGGDPTVHIIGAGHNGLEAAAILTCLGVPTVVIDKNKRVGDNVQSLLRPL